MIDIYTVIEQSKIEFMLSYNYTCHKLLVVMTFNSCKKFSLSFTNDFGALI